MIQVLPGHERMELKVRVGLHMSADPYMTIPSAQALCRDHHVQHQLPCLLGPLMTISYRLDLLLIATGEPNVPEPFPICAFLAICDPLLFFNTVYWPR